ncbi:MAG: RDD family protein [Bacilli bacterium]|nr:RDD family protein [Bacilli bacterium]
MQAKFSQRLFAYVIDFIILLLVVNIVTSFIPVPSSQEEINNQIKELDDKYVNSEISINEYLSEYEVKIIEYDKSNIALNICQLIFILGYFVTIPVLNNGQTIGKKILKIKIVKNDGKLTFKEMIIRSFVTTSLMQLLTSTILVYFISSNYYFKTTTILTIIQILLVISTSFMILYRKDKKGVQDIITNTSVIEVEK